MCTQATHCPGLPPAETIREAGKGQGPTEKAMGLRLAPLGASVLVLRFLVAPETSKALHGELWPQARQQVNITRVFRTCGSPGGRSPGGAQHPSAGEGRWQPLLTAAARGSPCPATAVGPCVLTGGLQITWEGTHSQGQPLCCSQGDPAAVLAHVPEAPSSAVLSGLQLGRSSWVSVLLSVLK